MYFFLLLKTSFDIMKQVVGLKETSPTFKRNHLLVSDELRYGFLNRFLTSTFLVFLSYYTMAFLCKIA